MMTIKNERNHAAGDVAGRTLSLVVIWGHLHRLNIVICQQGAFWPCSTSLLILWVFWLVFCVNILLIKYIKDVQILMQLELLTFYTRWKQIVPALQNASTFNSCFIFCCFLLTHIFSPQNFKQQQDSRTQKWILLWFVFFGKIVSINIIPFSDSDWTFNCIHPCKKWRFPVYQVELMAVCVHEKSPKVTRVNFLSTGALAAAIHHSTREEWACGAGAP